MSRVPKWLWPLAIILLVAATMQLPYGYYTFLRITICGFCGVVATFAFLDRTTTWTGAFAPMAILFNPIIPVHLNRQTWFWLDLGAATIIAAHLGYRVFTEAKPTR